MYVLLEFIFACAWFTVICVDEQLKTFKSHYNSILESVF